MKKALLVIGYKTLNYGSVLQAYATQRLFEKAGVSVEILNMESLWPITRRQRVLFYLKNGETGNLIARKGGVYLSGLIKRFHKSYGRSLERKRKNFASYIRDNFSLTAEVKSWREASELADNFEIVVIGSDQVWLPSSVMTDIYTLAFADHGQIKIAYAPSFGLGKIPEKYWEKYREMLHSFHFLSVREKSGVEIVKEISGLKCEVVADPVYMLERSEWLEKIPDKILFEKPYIFIYLLGNNRWQRDMITRYAKYRGIKTVAFIHSDQYIGYDEKYFDRKIADASPEDFLNFIRHAELIFTDSFHCVSFSIIENKEFYAFRRYKGDSEGSTNTRLDSLFCLLHINQDRLLTKFIHADEMDKKKMNYDEINSYLKEIKKSSREFVKNAVENVKRSSKASENNA